MCKLTKDNVVSFETVTIVPLYIIILREVHSLHCTCVILSKTMFSALSALYVCYSIQNYVKYTHCIVRVLFYPKLWEVHSLHRMCGTLSKSMWSARTALYVCYSIQNYV